MEDYGAVIEALTLTRVQYGSYHPYWYHYQPPKTIGKVSYKYYNSEGKLHRIYGPAYVNQAYHIEEWFKEGKHHRLNGPAVIHNSNYYWLKDGEYHRLGGPAIVTKNGPKQYWINGQRYSPKEYKKEMARRERKGLPTQPPAFNS